MSPNHRRQGRGKIETDPDRQARSFSTCQASRPPHTDVIVITRVLGRGTRRSQRRKDLFRSRSRPPELLLADLASADSLSSSWTIPNRAAAHDVLSSKRRSPSSPRAWKSLKPSSPVRRRIRRPRPNLLPAISSSRQSLPPREKVSASKERNRDTRVTSDLPFPRRHRQGVGVFLDGLP